MATNSLFFFRAPESYEAKAVAKHITAEIPALIRELSLAFAALPTWAAPSIHEQLTAFAAAKGLSLGKLAQPIRLAVCGGTVSPPIDASLSILGRSESLARLARALTVWGT